MPFFDRSRHFGGAYPLGNGISRAGIIGHGYKIVYPPSSDPPPRKAQGSPDEWGKCMGPIGVEGILTVEERLPLKDL